MIAVAMEYARQECASATLDSQGRRAMSLTVLRTATSKVLASTARVCASMATLALIALTRNVAPVLLSVVATETVWTGFASAVMHGQDLSVTRFVVRLIALSTARFAVTANQAGVSASPALRVETVPLPPVLMIVAAMVTV